jgi:hypothetical protein
VDGESVCKREIVSERGGGREGGRERGREREREREESFKDDARTFVQRLLRSCDRRSMFSETSVSERKFHDKEVDVDKHLRYQGTT